MSIVRVSHDKKNPYVMINREALWDKNLSLEAVGLWARLLSRPDDWHINVIELSKSCGCHRNTIYKILKELEENGYCAKKQVHGANGKFKTVEYHVYEKKLEKDEIQIILPLHKNTDTAKPDTADRALLNNENYQVKKINKVVCYPDAVSRESEKKSVDEEKKKAHLESSKKSDQMPQKLIKKHFDGYDIEVSLDSIFRHAVNVSKDWKTSEINEAWKILTEYSGPIRDPIQFFEGTIRNLRNSAKSEYLKTQGKKKCPPISNTQTNFNEKSSGKDSQELVSLGALLEERMREKSLIGSKEEKTF